MTANDLTITVLRRQLDQRKILDRNIHNLAVSMLKPGTKLQFKANGNRDYFGSVVEIVGGIGTTQVRVRNLLTQKVRDIHLGDITGIVQEN